MSTTKYETLIAYQRGALRDQGSRGRGCGPLPEKIDVRKLHNETMDYAERAKKILARTQSEDKAKKDKK